jgi:biopolymer transport protein ExbB/TolQ
MLNTGSESKGNESALEKDPFRSKQVQIDWSKRDIEQRLGFGGGRYTSPNKVLAFLIGMMLTIGFYVLIIYLQRWAELRWLTAMFLERGVCPYPTMFLFFWALAVLFLKWRKIAMQTETLALPLMPQEPDFVLTPDTARAVRDRVSALVDNPHRFILINRIDLALANLHNIGRTGDVATILKIQAENDEAQIASSYSLVNGFLWAIPVLGFIGTVLGLSQAIGAFTGTLEAGGDLDAIRQSLRMVTGGLSTAFETTLVALVCALILQLLVSVLQMRESEFLDACNDICHKHVAGKLRLSNI